MVVGGVLAATAADAAPMFTKLSDVRAKSAQVVVGTVTTSKAGPTIDVEYSLRGNAPKGPMKVGRSPDGHVWVPQGKPPRVVAFIDKQNRFRWIGKLIAGPTLETGVIRVEGFFDFNAHLVGPGVMTLSQLHKYLTYGGTMHQRFRATLAFPDGKGGLRRTRRTITVDYDPFKRTTVVRGPRWPCLRNASLMPPSWGRFSVRFYCRHSNRRLVLEGPITGKHKSGVILAEVTPSGPVLYEREFNRYVGSAKHTQVRRVVRIDAGKRSWRWVVDKGIYDAVGRLHKATGSSTSGSSTGSAYVATYTYRFGAITVRVRINKRQRGNHRVRFLQWADANKPCTIRVGGQTLACRLRSAPPIWR